MEAIATMITAKTVDFSYDEVEDRLVLDCKDAAQCRRLLLTRRLTRRLIGVLAGALERSSPTVRNAPAGSRREVMALEHFTSLAAGPPTPAGEDVLDEIEAALPDGGNAGQAATAAGGAADTVPPDRLPDRLEETLVRRIDMDSRGAKFHLHLHGTEEAGDALVTLNVSRGEMHRILAALDHWARQAEWELDADGGWLQGAEQTAMSAGGRIAC